MNFLAEYGSDSEEETDNTHNILLKTASQTVPPIPTSTTNSTLPAKSFASKLPSASLLLGGSGAGISGEQFKPTPIQSSKKRPPQASATGPNDLSVKQQRQTTAKQPASKSNMLLPPQLRGRSNTATVDLEGMGISRKK
mmetsp:Transcript_5109/g.6942  ORF Transcript_5109/g.6942 Transcript_5109/m.6942 type:complete len:139 (-) Transcript_5109:167-583(-)